MRVCFKSFLSVPLMALVACVLLPVGEIKATVLLQFSNGGIGATNFANASGQVTNDMLWGIVIDSSGNGFNQGTYDAFNINSSGFLTVNGVATDDYYYFTNAYTLSLGAPFYSGVEAGSGAITSVSGVPSTGDGVNGVAAGDPFALIWFPSTQALPGGNYGFLTNQAFQLPASGTESFTNVFNGQDPTRSASFTFASVVPEPSKTLLGMIGVAMALFRRKRK